jgi:hypothetical protein
MAIFWILIRSYFQFMENLNIKILVLISEGLKLKPTFEAPNLPFMLVEVFSLKMSCHVKTRFTAFRYFRTYYKCNLCFIYRIKISSSL